MRRDDAIRRIPQRIVFRQGFRIRHVQRRASETASAVAAVQGVVVAVGFEGGDEVGLHHNLAAGDVGYESVLLLPQDGELFGAEEVGCLFCQRNADEEVVDVLREEMVQARFVQAAEPGLRDRTVRVAGPGDDESTVVFRFRRRAWGGRVRDDVHTQAASDSGDLAAYAAVAEDAESLTCLVPQTLQDVSVRGFAPIVIKLPGVEEGVVMRMGQRGQDDPFGDLRAVDAGRGGQWDRGFCVDWRVGDVVRAGGEEVDELEIRAGFWTRREGGECGEDGCVFVEFFRYLLFALPRRAGEAQTLERDLDIRMVLPDPVENLGWFFEGHDNEQMLGLGVGTAAHGEG